ncbi:MAG: PHP domain-containing protein [Ruminococcaceae bacterium]|nr:PHP domain-containing protein [Oscillospiraceae bacterium]
MEMMVNLHTHTVRCNHASGTEREYIETAVRGGLKRLGFSDHAPYVFKDGYYSNYRMRPEQQEDYVATLQALRDEYKDKIDIQIGYEAEYYPEFFEAFLRQITRFEVNYLILGQHFIENEITRRYSGVTTTDEDYLKTYVDQTCEAMRTGLFTYFAHPDLLNFTGDPAIYDKHYARLIGCAIDRKMPLEINLLGIRENRPYPHEAFFRLCGEMGAEVCIGCDAHSADVTVDKASFAKAMDMAERYNLAVNHNPTLREIKF